MKVDFLVRYFEDLGFDSEEQSSFEISKEDVEVLLSRCQKVINNPNLAEEILPTLEGTGYDEFYYDSVKAVKKFIKKVLLPKFDELQDRETIYFEII